MTSEQLSLGPEQALCFRSHWSSLSHIMYQFMVPGPRAELMSCLLVVHILEINLYEGPEALDGFYLQLFSDRGLEARSESTLLRTDVKNPHFQVLFCDLEKVQEGHTKRKDLLLVHAWVRDYATTAQRACISHDNETNRPNIGAPHYLPPWVDQQPLCKACKVTLWYELSPYGSSCLVRGGYWTSWPVFWPTVQYALYVMTVPDECPISFPCYISAKMTAGK